MELNISQPHLYVLPFSGSTPRERSEESRLLTRRILASYLGCTPEAVPLVREELQKPALASPFESYQFNVAHSNTYFVLALARDAVIGVDIETLNAHTDILAISKRFFHPEEHHHVLQAQDPVDVFFRIWTQKEAFVKAIGEGLSFGLERFSVDPVDVKILKIEDARYRAEDFYSRLMKIDATHYLCLTSTQPLDTLRCFSSFDL